MDIPAIVRVAIAAAALVFTASIQHDAAQAQAVKAEEKQATVQQPTLPDAYKMDMLIRTTLIALSQANLTGNYTVLRDLGSPSFQSANTAARLAEAFTDLRQRKLDFAPILFFSPKLVRQPGIDTAGRLRLTGFLDTQPERINFDLMFEQGGGEWRLFGLAVQMQPAPSPTASTDQKNAPAPKERAATKTASPAKK